MAVSSSSRSRSTRKDLPVDVVEEILLRLLGKHVLRCKLLSKTYYALIKTPTFTRKHGLFHHQFALTNRKIVTTVFSGTGSDKSGKTLVLLQPTPSEVYIPPPAKSAVNFLVVGSSNGLLCAQVNTDSPNNMDTSFFLLWNPLTREHMTILTPPILPCLYRDAIGFGYDETADDYKLVKISKHCHLEFWSLKTNSWSEVDIPEPMTGRLYACQDTSLLVRGKFYWLSHVHRDNRLYHLLESFDLVTNSFRAQIIIPDVVTPQTIIDFMGSLACSVNLVYLNRHRSDIWVMDDDNHNSWKKQFSIWPLESPIWFSRTSVDGKLLTKQANMKLWSYGRELAYFLYDPRNKEQKEISLDHHQITRVSAVREEWVFIESIATFTLSD